MPGFCSENKQVRGEASVDLSDTFLNQALCAYVETISSRTRLVQFMEQANMIDQLSIVEADLNRALKETENFLWDEEGGVRWNEAFEQKLYRHIKQSCPWLDEQGFAPLRSFSMWFCWHEGLNA